MLSHRGRIAALAAILLGSTGVAAAPPAPASSAPPPAAAPVIPPRLDPAPQVDYPAGAQGDAEVVLLLTIEKDGSVRAVSVERGEPPFAAAATEAARGWRFQPATREGAPIAAKIRFAVSFHGPMEVPAPEPPAPAPAPVVEATPPKKPVQAKPAALEVTVRAEKPAPTVSTLSRAEVRALPGAFGDPFRAIEILPGVTPVVSGLPYFYVRGAPPGNVGYTLDGVRVPYLFHVAVGPSIVNPAMVERVDLYPGGYPARYGRFAGAVVAAETTAPRDDFHGEANLRLFDAGAMVETGFAGGKGSALIGGRYSYTAALFSLISPTVHLDYRDYQARVSYALTPKDRITLFAFGSYDLLEQEKNGISTIVFGSEFYRLDARYDHQLPHGGSLRWAATWGFDQTRVGEQRNARDLLAGTRVELEQPVAPELTVRAGLDAQFDKYAADEAKWADPDDPGAKAYNALFPPRDDAVLGAWADVVWRPRPQVEITPGLRADLFRSGDASAASADPRISLRVDLTPRVRLLQAYGLAHQTPSFVIPLPGVALANLRDGLQTSVQASAGMEVDLPYATTATVTLFNNVFLNMTDTLGLSVRGDLSTINARSLGAARGLEVYVRRRVSSQLGGFISYTFSRSTRAAGTVSFPAAFDRTHVLNMALSYDFGRGYRMGARFTLYTGAPVFSSDSIATASATGALARDPLFYRLDLRAEKRWSFAKSRFVSLVAEMLNTTLHKEIVNSQEVGPISIPSLGLEGGF
jgi:TonB family protein